MIDAQRKAQKMIEMNRAIKTNTKSKAEVKIRMI